MPELDEQIRAYFDALVDVDPAEGQGGVPPAASSGGEPSMRRRRMLVGAAMACLISVALVAAIFSGGPSQDVSTFSSTSMPAGFVPNERVPSDVIDAQAMGATVVVPVTEGLYLTAVREGEFMCLQLNTAGRSDGPRSCDMPASSAWPDGPMFAVQVMLGDRKFAIGAAAAEQVADVAVDGPGEASPGSLAEATMPFPTLRFFFIPAGGARAVDAFSSTGSLVSSVVLRPSAPAPDRQTSTTVSGASSADVNVGRLLAAFALEPTDETFRPIPFADGPVRLLYHGDSVSGFADAAELRDPSLWEVDQRTGDGESEPVSALTVLGSHPQDDLSFYPAPYTSCATSPEPIDFAYDEHVIIEPNSIDSCSEWFGIDLYLAGGRIVAIGLVLPAE